eukprot:COSAG01_NODE_2260_length_8057_cov_50.825527_10_plen_61_part_00
MACLPACLLLAIRLATRALGRHRPWGQLSLSLSLSACADDRKLRQQLLVLRVVAVAAARP